MSSHRQADGGVDTTWIFQSRYSSELNPIARLFEDLQRQIEGRNSPSLQGKMAAVDRERRRLASRPEAVVQRIGYDWMGTALDALTDPEFMPPT